MVYDDCGLLDNPDPPPERENREEIEKKEEDKLDANDDWRWHHIEKSLDKALKSMHKRRQ